MSNRVFSLTNLYLYLVSLITLIIFIFSCIMTVNNVMEVVIDDSEYYSPYIYEEGNIDEFSKAKYEEYRELENKRREARNIKDLASSIASMIISGGFWLYHWIKIESKKNLIRI